MNTNTTNAFSVEHFINATQLSKNLHQLIKSSGTTKSGLAKALDIPYMTICRLVNGSTKDPRLSTLKLIADFFSISIDSLIGTGDPSNIALNTNKQPRTIPILNWNIIATTENLSELDLATWERWQPVVLNDPNSIGKHAYALESRKSMHPRFPLGTIFIIDPEAEPRDGDIILVKIKKDKAVSLRDLVIDPPNWYLQPIIQESNSLVYSQFEHKIIGVVIMSIFETRLT